MRQFYETYRGGEKVSALLRQLPWTHNLVILGKSKRAEEREFYLHMGTSEKWSSRELERQINGALFEGPVGHALALRGLGSFGNSGVQRQKRDEARPISSFEGFRTFKHKVTKATKNSVRLRMVCVGNPHSESTWALC